jgi:cation-transporting ATPase 13A3/4/5
LALYTRQGFRVIAIGKKKLNLSIVKIQREERESAESDLEFLGLIVMENSLKKETADVIRKLKNANIRTIMCTGDNLLTGISVSQECLMVDKHETIKIIHAQEGQDCHFENYDEVIDVVFIIKL